MLRVHCVQDNETSNNEGYNNLLSTMNIVQRYLKKRRTLGNGTIAILLAGLTIILLTATASKIGLTTDEQAYMTGAESYARWFLMLVKDPPRALQPANIETYWTVNHEHPPVEKLWSGLVWLATRRIFGEFVANRLGVISLVGLLAALLYLLIAGNYGKPAGLFAVAALLSMPRFFFHAHLAALDVPVAVASFAVVFAFWKGVDRKGWAWGLLWGVVWGLAVAVKLNGVFILIALIAWILIFRRKWLLILHLGLMGLTALITFFLVWPWLYNQTWTRLIEYVNFHLHHYSIGQWYLGQFYSHPPWPAVFVIIWAVIPLTTTILYLAGMTRAGNGKRDGGLGWLLIFGAFVSISPFIFGENLLYNSERLFMPVFPFLAGLAGVGFASLVSIFQKWLNRLHRPGLALPALIILGVGLLAPQSVSMAGLYPHLLSYYSESVGGVPGAMKLGFETTYWGETYIAAIPYINSHAKSGDVIWVDDGDHLRFYQELGILRQDVRVINTDPTVNPINPADYGNFGKADWFIFQFRQSQYGLKGEQNFLPLQILKTQTPLYELAYRGVPLMRLYGRLQP